MAENGKSSFGWFKVLILFVLIPLVLTVVGGLLVEYLKPMFLGPAPPIPPGNAIPVANVPAAVTAQDAAAFRKANTLKALVGKWNVTESATIYGDKQIEFTPNGQMVRTTNLIAYGDITNSYPYSITDEGQIQTDPALAMRLISVNNDELKLAFGGLAGESIISYKRPWPTWMLWLAGAGFVVLCLFGAVLDAWRKKR